MTSDRVSNTADGSSEAPGEWLSSALGMRVGTHGRTLLGAACLLLLHVSTAGAHWMRPGDIVVGLARDAQLRDKIGVVRVQRDARLPRLLLIIVRRSQWDAVPEKERIALAEEWWATWRHNVSEGIVSILDAATEQSVVNFDGLGRAHLKPRAATPAPGK